MPDYQETIAKCSRMLVGNSDVTGQGRQINAPLLSIFLGRDAEAHREDVFSTYQNCWLGGAKALGSLTAQDYSPDGVLAACSEMLSARLFKNYSTLYLAYYWDVMDDRFDTFFQAVKQPLSFPTAIAVESLFFVFCRELAPGARERKETRLRALIAWAQETNRHLIVLSDLTPATGLLSPDKIGESYRLAANILLISDTYFSPGEKDLGRELTFFLSQRPVYSAGYYVLKKNTWDIATTCLWQILDDYQHLPDTSHETKSVKEGLCGAGNGYDTLFQQIFDQKMAPLLPQDTTFLRYLPYTDEVRRLDDNLKGVPTGFSLFGRRSAPQAVNQETAEAAIHSIRPIWDACLELYYRRPVLAWMESAAGSAFIAEFFRQKLNLALDFESMSNLLLQEAEELEKLARGDGGWLPQASESLPMQLSVWLHHRACRELQSTVFCQLARRLADAMRRMHRDANGFERVLTDTKANLQIEGVEPCVRSAYGAKTRNLLAASHDLLARKISPCSGEADLLEQASAVFAELVQMDPVYRLSLKHHFNFLINSAAPTDVDNIIGACFHQNMYHMGRLQTYSPPDSNARMYCMVSQGNFEERIDPQLHGDVFIVPRTDCIERLLVYPIAPDDIIY